MNIESIIKIKQSNFNNWRIILENHLDYIYQNKKYSDNEFQKTFYETNQVLADIADCFYKYGNFRDKIDDSKCYLNYLGQNLILKSEKTKSDFYWGLEKNDFYLKYDIRFPLSLKSMDDDFWIDFLKLSKLGEFKFSENEIINSNEKKYFKKYTKSNLFQLMSNYFIHEIDSFNLEENEKYYSFGLGELTIKWSIKTDWKELIEKTSETFRILHKMNYKLWKIQDTKDKKTLANNS